MGESKPDASSSGLEIQTLKYKESYKKRWAFPGPSQVLTFPSLKRPRGRPWALTQAKIIKDAHPTLATLSHWCYHRKAGTGAWELLTPGSRTASSNQPAGLWMIAHNPNHNNTSTILTLLNHNRCCIILIALHTLGFALAWSCLSSYCLFVVVIASDVHVKLQHVKFKCSGSYPVQMTNKHFDMSSMKEVDYESISIVRFRLHKL